MKLTLEQWFALDTGGRSVVIDQLLERIPAGYYDTRSVGHEAQVLPQFIHRETGVLFNVVFGGVGVMGMTESRFDRIHRVRLDEEEADEYGISPMPDRAEVSVLQPPQAIEVRSALVADTILPFGVLRKLGIDESQLNSFGVSPIAVALLRRTIAQLGWRAPSEAEWEFVCRSVDDTVDAVAPALAATGRLANTGLEHMGRYAELCRDSWHDELVPSPAGDGHEVLRGRGLGGSFVGWRASQSWSECVWPGRHRLAQWRDSVAVRPWVDFL